MSANSTYTDYRGNVSRYLKRQLDFSADKTKDEIEAEVMRVFWHERPEGDFRLLPTWEGKRSVTIQTTHMPA